MSVNSIPAMANAYQKTAGLAPEQANPNNNGVRAHGQPQLPEQASERAKEVQQTHLTIRQQTQASIVEMMFSSSESATQNSLKITYQEAIDKINEILTAEIGDQVTDETTPAPISEEALEAQGGMDYWTPENTAKRIVEGGTAFLAGFQAAHPELQGEALMDRFMEVVGGGITQGFDQAKGILGDLNVLEGDIESNIDLTYNLVQEGLTNFRNQYLGITPEAVDLSTDQAAIESDSDKTE
ncbi:MAG: DUF5610 domain-containing protein [Pseudomonadota bacterium]|nr:DUF5610 domain-containing protein [Pseudomonadota bacterium]